MLKAVSSEYVIAQYTERRNFNQDNSHFHMHYEIYYLISGKRRYIIDNNIYDMEAGDIMLIPPMIMHKTQRIPDADENERHERILFNIMELPEILKPVFQRNFYRPSGREKEKIKELIDESVNEKSNDETAELLHHLNLQKILLILSRLPKENTVPQQLSERDRLMQNAAGYIKENCYKPIMLKDIADEFGFTPEYFSLVFKRAIGLNFVDYLNNMRVAMAMPYLADTDMHISQISDKCGFNDSNYFTIVFKKVTGTSPTKYRKAMKK